MMGPAGPDGRGRGIVIAVVCMAGLLILGLIAAPMLFFASSSQLFTSGGGCSAAHGKTAGQPPPSQQARNSIPANYLALFKATGHKYGIPWVILAGIGRVESDDGRTTLPGVHSGSNAFGAAGPMQIGIGGASGDTWGGAPVHPAGEHVNGVAIDANHDGVASVYEPADAIAGAARYLLAHGILDNVSNAIFAYNHLVSYVQTVLSWAGTYSNGGFSVSPVTVDARPGLPARRRPGGQRGGQRRDRLRRAATRQALPVGRHRPGCLRLLRPGDGGLPGGRDHHPAHVASSSGRGGRESPPTRSSQVTWCSLPVPTAPRHRQGTSA